jgi:hypothetical protein
MLTNVTDARSNPNDQIAHAARVVGRSATKRLVFDAISSGKRRVKSVGEIAAMTGLSRKQVLDAARPLVNNHLFVQTKKAGDTAYEKDAFYASNKKKILKLGGDPSALSRFPTKTNPISRRALMLAVTVPAERVRVEMVTVDDIRSFAKVRSIPSTGKLASGISEAAFKRGIQNVVGETGTFKDWGGERSDLWTTRIQLKSARVAAALAFKGPGQRGKLTPAKLGKNGDQIQRLFQSSARLFLVQYWNQIDESVVEQMHAFAQGKAVFTGERIFYGVIDGTDTMRLIEAYPGAFRTISV